MKIVMDLHASFSLTSIASLISFQLILQINLATIREYWVWDLGMYLLSSGDLQLRSSEFNFLLIKEICFQFNLFFQLG